MAATGDNVIEVRGLTAIYGDAVIFKNVSFDVKRGEVFVILGGSGSGKSTMLRHMVGLNAAAEGSVLIEGDDLAQADGADRRAILQRFGVMFQTGALFGSLTLLENVRLPMEEFTSLPRDAMNLAALMKLKLVGLKDFAGHLPSEISGGMKKRAAIARAMALDPGILFLDEPSAGLDPITSAELDQLILELSRTLGITFVVVTHELDSIYTIADRVIMLGKEAKGIVAEGDPRRLRDESKDPWVRDFFNRRVESKPA